jgi:glycosyltransferase involved in cell wall biosynthesis
VNLSTWHILTGEYPPGPGGVGDYSAILAAALGATGASVHVWTTAAEGETPEDVVDGVTVHRVAGGWSPSDLARVGEALDAFPAPRRLLVQYAPNVWGYKGLNFGFCRWLLGRRRDQGDEIRLMFHEVAYPFEFPDKPKHWVLAAGQRLMARTLVKASDHVDVSTPSWAGMLRVCTPGARVEYQWRPVPSNVTVIDDSDGVSRLRRAVAPGGGAVIGSFSAFSKLIAPMLAGALPGLLRAGPDRVGLLIGRRGDQMAARLIADHPELTGRIVGTGALTPEDVSRCLQACDLVVQPYPDGVTGRRGSVMAALAHGVATVTNTGRLTEPLWAESGAVGLAEGLDEGDLIRAAERLLHDPRERMRVGAAGRDLHERRFAIERTVEAIVGQPARVAP